MNTTLLQHCRTRRVLKLVVATSLGLTFVITGQAVHASPSLPAQSCGTPPCVPPTTPTTPQPLPDATTTSGTSATTKPARGLGGSSSATSGGAATSRSKGSLAITGGDIAGMLLIGTVLVGSGATAVVLGRRRRAGHYG